MPDSMSEKEWCELRLACLQLAADCAPDDREESLDDTLLRAQAFADFVLLSDDALDPQA